MAGITARKVTVQVPAKLNLCLDVVGEDGKGYHLLDGGMLAVDLYDTLTLCLEEGEGIEIDCNRPGVPLDESNLAARAARAFFQGSGAELSQKLRIHIKKQIPAQAGMAGGSADAAAVLVGLNHLRGMGLTLPRLMELGLGIGSDVPFCLLGGCARAQGRGERLETLPLPQGVLVIAKPVGGTDTRGAFALYDRRREQLRRPDVEAMVSALRQQDGAGVGRAMANVFEQVCAPDAVHALVKVMGEQGALGASMTGTGTAVASLFPDESAAQRCLQLLKQKVLPLEYLGLHRPVEGGATMLEAAPPSP